MRLGHYDQLLKFPPDARDAASPVPIAIATMEELLAAVKASGGAGSYEWLPAAAQEGLVALLAASVLRAPGKLKPAAAHVEKGALGCAYCMQGVAAAGGGGKGGFARFARSSRWPLLLSNADNARQYL